jgi:uncharacterized membrane protein YjgN (DUF898 family)
MDIDSGSQPNANPSFNTREYSQRPFQFTGSAREFFGIWIVNIALTILTLGIYSAWAKVRTHQYFYSNTQLDGSSFQYLASASQILKGRAVASFIFALYYVLNTLYPIWGIGLAIFIALLVPAVIVLSMSFRMRNTAYRNLTFRFERNFKQAYLIYGLPILLVALIISGAFYLAIPEGFLDMASSSESTHITQDEPQFAQDIDSYAQSASIELNDSAEQITLWPILIGILMIILGYPVWSFLKTRFLVTNTRYGTSPFKFEATSGSFYRLYIAAFFVITLTLIVFGALMAGIEFFLTNTDETVPADASTQILSVISMLPLYLWAFAYMQTKKANLIFNHTFITDMQLESKLSVSYMFYLYLTNTIGILLSLGLLIPWTMVRTARYRANTLTLLTSTELDDFIADQQVEVNALGEEFGEVFDIEVGI